MWWNEATNRRVVHHPGPGWGSGWAHGFGFYQIELQHLAGFYLRTTIREQEKDREQERKKKCNGLVEDGVDHYRVGWVHRNINWTRYRQLELELESVGSR